MRNADASSSANVRGLISPLSRCRSLCVRNESTTSLTVGPASATLRTWFAPGKQVVFFVKPLV